MLKRISAKAVAVLLALCLVVSMVSIGTIAVSANPIAEFAIDKLLDTGMRVAGEAVAALGEATGNEDVEEAFSFINDWVFKDASEVAAEKTQELCEQILEELNYVEEEIEKGDAAISQMIANESVSSAKTALSNQWSNDIDGVLSNCGAKLAFDSYKTYLSNAVNQTGTAEADLKTLMYNIAKMSKSGIDMNQEEAQIKKQIFTDSTIVTAFETLIHDLAEKLDYSDPNTSVAQCAARYAYLSYPFSHQQYPYVRNMMEKQIMYLINAEMLYNEFLFQQGEYFKNSPEYGVESAQYTANQNAQKYYYNTLMNDANTGANNKIAAMLGKEMVIDQIGGVKLSLDDYMKPEDAVSTTLNVNSYEDDHDFYAELTKVAKNNDIVFKDGTNKSKAAYTKRQMNFKRVMTHTSVGSKVFYILDPEQFKGTDALYIKNLEHDAVVGPVDIVNPDCHTPSCDYLNFNKDMTDGVNTFHGINSYDCSNIDALFATNFFSAKGSTVSGYLGAFSDKYLPDTDTNPGTGKNYLISSMYRYDHWSSVNVGWAHIKIVDCSKSFSGTGLLEIRTGDDNDELNLEHAAGNKSETYSVILGNKSDTFSQNVTAEVTDSNSGDLQIITSDGGTTVANGETKSIRSGDKLTVKFKAGGSFKSLRVSRNSDVYNNKGTVTETVLIDRDSLSLLKPDADGWYSIHYAAPYSDATFTLDTGIVKYISNPQELIDFSDYVNSGVTDANGIVTADIDMTGYENKLNPIGYGKTYSGVFEGNDHTISNLVMTGNWSGYGLFGTASGTIQNLKVNGKITLTANADSIGGIVGYSDGCTLEHIYCDIELTNRDSRCELQHVGGIVGTVQNNETRINRCLYSGEMSIYNSVDCIGGIVGYSNGGARISNCGCTSSIYADEKDALVGGILGYVNNYGPTVTDCYFNGTMYDPNGSDNLGEIIGLAKRCTPENISNNYYVAIANTSAFGKNSMDGLSAGMMTIFDFKSGQVTYKLNSGVTDGTQTWYQIVDKGSPADVNPVFESDHGTVYWWDRYGDYYSNYEQRIFVTKVVLTPSPLVLNMGESVQVNAELTPTDAEIQTLKWSSNNENVATVDQNGVVTGKNIGVTKIRAQVDDHVFGESCEINVQVNYAPPTEAPTTAEPTEEPTTVEPTEEPTTVEPTVAPTTVEPTVAPTTVEPTEEPTTVEPTVAPATEPATEPTTSPDPSEAHGIRTYADLVAFANTVNSGDNSADAYLENNIMVSADDQLWTDGIGTESAPFNGTFDGKGYYIVGLRVDIAGNGGLFGEIGTNGVVRDLSVMDCDFKTVSENAGGIAAVNNGTIDHCNSGINLSGKVKFNGKIIDDVAAYNSYICGTFSGGIAAVNSGTVTGCRNSAVVEGVCAGGVAAVNEGKIYGSASNGMAGSIDYSCKTAGGIAGTNKGEIASCYDSGKPVCKDKNAKGMIAGDNQSDKVKDVFYTNVDGNTPVGEMSDQKLPDNSGLVSASAMQKEAFVATLNDATDDTVTWIKAQYGTTSFNQGYPIIQSRALQQRSLLLQNRMTVGGLMHSDLQVALEQLSADSEEYKAFASMGGSLLAAYSFHTTDADGNYAPSELWGADGYQLTIPANGKSLVLFAQNTEGETVIILPDSVQDGNAVFSFAELNSFAVAEAQTALIGDVNRDGKVNTIDATLIQKYSIDLPVDVFDVNAADVNGDGRISVLDTTCVQKYAAEFAAGTGNAGKTVVFA